MRYSMATPVAALLLLALSACSSEPDEVETSEEHVWKGQTEAIDKAREVETILKREQPKED